MNIREIEKRMDAQEFLCSSVGQMIVGQALLIAIRELEAVRPEVLQQKSNLASMRYLLDNLFSLGRMHEPLGPRPPVAKEDR